MHWECPRSDPIRLEELGVARPDTSEWPPCLVNAGILPEHPDFLALESLLPAISQAPEAAAAAPLTGQEDELWRDGRVIVHTDGGDLFPSGDERLHRGGSSGFWGPQHPRNGEWVLEGPAQSINRAEAAAVLRVLREEPAANSMPHLLWDQTLEELLATERRAHKEQIAALEQLAVEERDRCDERIRVEEAKTAAQARRQSRAAQRRAAQSSAEPCVT